MLKNFYITTAIDYPNAAPHMGHVLEKVLADVFARYHRLQGENVRFQIGTDEHGTKIQQKAKEEGMEPGALVDKNVRLFEDLYAQLHISADIFMRTSDRSVEWPNVESVMHRPTVEALWIKLQEAGVLEKRTYKGLYCSGCERFITEKELVDGKCPDHHKEPDKVSEQNWFFTLSKDTAWLKMLLKDSYHIEPEYRSEETLALLERGLEDVSFSRPKESLSWGIPVPGDEAQTMYVWCDALTNYISGLGYITEKEDKTFWDDAEVTHVIGKDIARFHALIWPAMLKHAGIKTPNRLLMHGFITSDGKKMSKSLGNVVNPVDVLARFSGNPDPLRFFLLHEVPVGRDGDFSWKRLEEMYNAKLRNDMGNLLNRVLVMLGKIDKALVIPADPVWIVGENVWDTYEESMNQFDSWKAIQLVFEWSEACNKWMNDQAPWKLESDEEKGRVLSILAENLRHIALMLLPFMPDTAHRISMQLGVPYADQMTEKNFVLTNELQNWNGGGEWKSVGSPEILFHPLEEKKS